MLLASIEMGQCEHISMKNLRIIAEYIGTTFTDPQSYKQGLDVVLKGDINNVYVVDISVVEEDYRKRIIGYFAGCLKNFAAFYGIDQTKKIINASSQKEVDYKRS